MDAPLDTIADDLSASAHAREAGDHVLGAERAEHARAAALQRGDALRAANASRLLSLHLWRQGSSERAVQVALEALPVIDAADMPEASIDLRNSLTMAYVALDMPGDALPHAVEALRRARSVAVPAIRGWCLNRLDAGQALHGDDSTLRDLLDLRHRAYKARGRFARALEQIRDIERRENRKRIESHSRLLLRDIEVANARHEAERLRAQSREWAERAQAATQAALRDALTGLPNRRALDEQLGERLRAPADRKHFAAALIDIDHLEVINDSRGHEVGDRVLRELGQLLDVTMRRGDVAFRMGGEEFVLLINAPTLSQAEAACERVRLRVERHGWLAAQRADAGQPSLDGSVTVSIGVTTVASDDDAASLLRRADQALYRAKHLGRNRVEAG